MLAPEILKELEVYDQTKLIVWEIERILKGKRYETENYYLSKSSPKYTAKTSRGRFFQQIRYLISIPTISDEEANKLEELDEKIKAQSENIEELPF